MGGTVVGPAPRDAYSIRFDSGSVFNIELHNIQGSGVTTPPPTELRYSTPGATFQQSSSATQHPDLARAHGASSSPAGTASANGEELEFQPGQKVEILAPPAMAGKRGEVIGAALWKAFAVRFDSGSVFNMQPDN